MKWLLPLIALLSAGLAGCIGDDTDDAPVVIDLDEVLSPKVFDILPPEEVWVESAVDGKRMNNIVYRPDTDEPVPVWINFSPYWGDTAPERGDAFSQYLIDEYVPRGYAVVLSAVRGTGHSEGCFQIGGDLELQDTYDVVDHFANVEWSNGHIGAGGKSYDSTTQNGMIAKYPHPALKTIFHVSGITDMYRYNYREGVTYASGVIFNTYYYGQGTDEYGASLLGAGTAGDETPESLLRILDDVLCSELPLIQANGVGSGATGMKTDYWIERDWNRYIADSEWEGSVFFVHGFQDWNVKPDHILPFVERLPEGTPIKAWLHQDTQAGTGHVYPMRADWNETMLRWMDHYLKGIDTGIEDEPSWELEGEDGTWRRFEQWPPTGPQTNLTVAGDGHLLDATGFAYRYTGQPYISATVVPLTQDAVFSAVLYEIADDGTRTWANEAVLRVQYHDGLEVPSPIVPGTPLDITAEFYPQEGILEPGHRYEVEFQTTPRHALALPTQLAALTVLEGAEVSLHLGVAGEGIMAPQPVDQYCFTC